MAGFDRSREDREVTVERTSQAHASPGDRPPQVTVVQERTVRRHPGDVRFLQVALRVADRQQKLWPRIDVADGKVERPGEVLGFRSSVYYYRAVGNRLHKCSLMRRRLAARFRASTSCDAPAMQRGFVFRKQMSFVVHPFAQSHAEKLSKLRWSPMKARSVSEAMVCFSSLTLRATTSLFACQLNF